MANRRAKSTPVAPRKIERELVQNKQILSTSVTSDVLFTADDMVTLKRIIWDHMISSGEPSVDTDGLSVLYLVPKDVAVPALTVTDGEIIAGKLILLPSGYAFTTESNGDSNRMLFDSKFNRPMQPGDFIVLVRIIAGTDLSLFEKSVVQLFLEH